MVRVLESSLGIDKLSGLLRDLAGTSEAIGSGIIMRVVMGALTLVT